MSIGLILDEKPEWCEDCIAHKEPYDLCGMVGKRNPHEWLPDWCPLQEVEPVRHGRWKYHSHDAYICTECGNEAKVDERMDVPGEYCPWCGAKMEMEGEG